MSRILLGVAGFFFMTSVAAFGYWIITVIYTGSNAEAAAASLGRDDPDRDCDWSGAITVGWTDPVTQVSGAQYVVTRTSGPGSPTTVCTVATGTTSCQDSSLTAGTSYSYSIAAMLDNWQSSAITTTTTTATPTFSITLSASPYTAGTAITVQTITAKIGSSTDTTYSGAKSITWSGLASSPSGQAPSYPSSSMTFASGVASPGTTFTPYAAGSSTLTATDSSAPGVTGSANFTVNGTSTVAGLLVTNVSSPQTAGNAFTVTATATDLYGNQSSNSVDSVSLGIVSGSPQTTFSNNASATMTATLSSGTATFSGVTFDTAGMGYALAAKDTTANVSAANSNTFTVNATTATKLAFTPATPGPGNAGASIPNVAVSVEDTYGNVVTTATGSVVMSIKSGSPQSGFTSGTAMVSLSSGVANFTNLVVVSLGSYTFTATPSGITGVGAAVNSNAFTVSSGTLDHFTVSTPSTATATAPGAPTVVHTCGSSCTSNYFYKVTAVNVSGETTAGTASTSVTNSSPLSSTHYNTITLPSSLPTGAASFNLYRSTNGTTYGLIVSSLAASAQVTDNGTYSQGVAPPATNTATYVSAGSAATVTVAAFDAYGNVPGAYSSATQCVTFSGPLNSPNNTAPVFGSQGSCAAGQTSLSFNSSGQATASITLSNAEITALTVTSVTPASKSGTSASFVVIGGAANHLAYSTEPPATATAGSALASFSVSVVDTYGNAVTSGSGATDTVTLSIATGPTGGMFNSATATYTNVAAVGGTATFTGIVLDTAGSYTLKASDTTSGHTSYTATSTPATVVSDAGLDHFTVTTPATATVSVPSAPTIVLTCSSSCTGTTWHYEVTAVNTSGETLPGTSASQVNNSTLSTSRYNTVTMPTSLPAGASSFNLYRAANSGSYTKIASAEGVGASYKDQSSTAGSGAPPVTNTATYVSAGTAASVTVVAFDAYGNVPSAYTSATQCVAFSGPLNSPNNTAPVYGSQGLCAAGQTSLSFNSLGQATTNITLSNAETTALTATSVTPAGQTGTSAGFVVIGGAASQLGFSQQPTNAEATVTITPAVTISVGDSFGNVVATDNSTKVTLAIGTNAGSPAGTLTGGGQVTVSSGVATYAGLSINSAGNGYTLSATDTTGGGGGHPYAAATSSTFNITPHPVTFTTAGTHTLTVPAHTTTVAFTILGGGGAGGNNANSGTGGAGGDGGTLSGTLNIPDSASATTLTVVVGGGGNSTTNTGGTGCFAGGTGGNSQYDDGGAGGGATCFYVTSSAPIAAAGGGGGGGGYTSAGGGDGTGGASANPGSSATNGGATGTRTQGSNAVGTGGGGGVVTTTGSSFPYSLSYIAGSLGTGNKSGTAGGTGASGNAGGTGGGTTTDGGNGGGGGGGGYASGGGGGGGGEYAGGGGGGGGAGYSGGASSISISGIIVGSGSNGGAGATSGTAGSATFTGVGISGS